MGLDSPCAFRSFSQICYPKNKMQPNPPHTHTQDNLSNNPAKDSTMAPHKWLQTLALLFPTCLMITTAAKKSGWKIGSATVYGGEAWEWNIHEGSCGLGYQWPDVGTGWDVASIPDARSDFYGSCGRCYEVACHPSTIVDGFGNKIDRQSDCYDSSWSVVVKTTDACPCNHPGSGFQYKRWCCGNTDHISLSQWAFEKLAPPALGSMGLKYREVPCTYEPANPAPPAKDPTPGISPPPGAIRPAGAQQRATLEPNLGFFDGFKSGWVDKSFKVESNGGQPGPSGGTAQCSKIFPGGAVVMGVTDGAFQGRLLLEAWVQTQDGIPDVSVNVAGVKGACASVPLQSLTPSREVTGFSRYSIYLGVFDKALQDVQLIQAFASIFKGCGGNKPSEINEIVLKNEHDNTINLCIDDVKLL